MMMCFWAAIHEEYVEVCRDLYDLEGSTGIIEKLLKSVTGAFACTVGVEDAKALRALSLC